MCCSQRCGQEPPPWASAAARRAQALTASESPSPPVSVLSQQHREVRRPQQGSRVRAPGRAALQTSQTIALLLALFFWELNLHEELLSCQVPLPCGAEHLSLFFHGGAAAGPGREDWCGVGSAEGLVPVLTSPTRGLAGLF